MDTVNQTPTGTFVYDGRQGADGHRVQDAINDRALTSDVLGTSKENAIETLDAKFHSERAARDLQASTLRSETTTVREVMLTRLEVKDAEIRASQRHGEVRAELAALRAEGQQRQIDQLRSDGLASQLSRILTKIGA